MATGDAAALEGFTPVSPSADIRLGYDDINRAADWTAGRTKGRRIAAAGSVLMDSLTSDGSNYSQTVSVTLPTGRFTSAPLITTGIQSVSPIFSRVGYSSASATSFLLYFVRANDTPTTVTWHAQQSG